VVCETFSQGDSLVHRLDPRVRVVLAAAFSLLLAVCDRFAVLGAGLGLAVLGAVVARLPCVPVLKRLLAVNLFMLLLWIVLPLTSPGPTLSRLGGLTLSEPGVRLAASITLKANAIVLCLTVFLGTVEITSLGHALAHLHVPDKLTHLFLFTVRYIDLFHHEYRRLRQAMKVRCFRPRMTWHTYRSFGYLVGMLLVQSFDRSERILAAMKCRGFRGRFYVLDHFAFARRDLLFSLASFVVLVLLIVAECL
jgi:cobalt/nickel transport system permease protein